MQTDPQYKLRLPADLKEKIKQASDENHRSMNAEIVARLQDSFEATDQARKVLDEETKEDLYQEFVERILSNTPWRERGNREKY